MTGPDLDIAKLRRRLSEQAPGRPMWRSLDAIADTPEFRRFLTLP